ncbi:hypothetical protein ACLOJK_033786 [Asimina triloba]
MSSTSSRPSSSIIIPPSFFLLILFFFSCQGGSCQLQLIQETCNKSASIDPLLSYDFCVASLEAVPESYTADLNGLGIISLKLALLNATHAEHRVVELQAGKQDLFTKRCLETCPELYSDATSSLEDSIKAFSFSSYDDANAYVSAAMDDCGTCEDGFKEKEGVVSPMMKENQDIFQLCAIALAITRLA